MNASAAQEPEEEAEDQKQSDLFGKSSGRNRLETAKEDNDEALRLGNEEWYKQLKHAKGYVA